MQPIALYVPIVACLAIDAGLYATGGYDATITAWIRKTPESAGIVGVLIGLLIGHLYLSARKQ